MTAVWLCGSNSPDCQKLECSYEHGVLFPLLLECCCLLKQSKELLLKYFFANWRFEELSTANSFCILDYERLLKLKKIRVEKQ